MNGLQQGNCVINLPHLWHPPRALSVGSYGKSHYEKINCGAEPAERPSVTSSMFQAKGNRLYVSSVNSACTDCHFCFNHSFRFAVLRWSKGWFLFFSTMSVNFYGPYCHVQMAFIINKVGDLANFCILVFHEA